MAENLAAIQQQLVANERAKKMAHEEAMKRDIRQQIARTNGYRPENDSPSTNLQPYPTWVKLPNGKSVIAQNAQEEAILLGKFAEKEPAKSVEVDVAALAHQPEVRQKRKYTKRAEKQPLPQNLD